MESNELLSNLTNHQIYALFHEIIDEICGSCGPQPTKYVPNVWSTETQFRNTCDLFRHLLANVINIRNKKDLNINICEEHKKILFECFEVRRPELRVATINNTIAERNPVLKDFYWKLNVILASDRITNINEPLMALDLRISEPKRDSRAKQSTNESIISLELNKQELTEMISTLEEAQHSLKQNYL